VNNPASRLAGIARSIGPLVDEGVFVGGSVLFVYVGSDPAPRPTLDVDFVVMSASLSDYELHVARVLRRFGWSEDTSEGAPVCRWVRGDGQVLDVMPANESVLGFSNRWYRGAVEHSLTTEVDGVAIRIASVPYYLATKIEAFLHRGKGDWSSSHDLEDVLAVIASFDDVVADIDRADAQVRAFLVSTFTEWLRRRQLRVPFATGSRLGDVPTPLEENIRGHFPGDEDGERMARLALARIRAIGVLGATSGTDSI